MVFRPYRRLNAVLYAHRWAYGRDPQFYNYEAIGGDCTNFASQCIYAGTGVMNETPLYGWYYINANNKSPSWTGVEYLYDFLTRPRASLGPVAHATTDLRDAQLGDVIQLRFNGSTFQHSPVVVQSSVVGSTDKILVSRPQRRCRIGVHSASYEYRSYGSCTFWAFTMNKRGDGGLFLRLLICIFNFSFYLHV